MNLICFSDIMWDFLKQRHHHILTRLPKDWNILFVEPSLAISIIKDPKDAKPRKVAQNIQVISMPVIPFFDKSQKLRKTNDSLIIFWSKYFAKKYNMKKPILLFYDPRFASVLGNLDESLVWYEVIDDRLFFKGVSQWLNDYIDTLTKNSDFITTSANSLYQKITQTRKNDVYLIGNGVDVAHFAKSLEDLEIPKDILSIKNPILGYIGTIAEWFDFELIKKILEAYPDVSVVVIGHAYVEQKKALNELASFKNFHFMGKKDYSILPNYLKAFSACLIPFKIYELTEAVNPIKFYEYCAAGKNVISTNLPEINHKDVFLAKNHEEFLKMIPDVLKESKKISNLVSLAKENDWKLKVNEITKIIQKYLK